VTTPQPTRILDLRDYARMIRASLRVVLVCALVVAIAAAGYVLLKPPVYEAHANVLVEAVINPAFSNLPGSTSNVLQPDLNTEAQVVKSTDLASAVITALNLNTTPQQLLGGLHVSVVLNTSLMQIGYVSPNPVTAAKVANSFANQYLVQRRAAVQQLANRVIRLLTKQINGQRSSYNRLESKIAFLANSTSPTDLITRQQLEHQAFLIYQTIRTEKSQVLAVQELASTSEGGRIVQTAVAPASPVGPNLPLAIAVGLFLGAIIGSGIAVGRGLWADRVQGRDELSDVIGAPALGVIPHVDSWVKRTEAELVTRDEPMSPAAEAYRLLATNVRFARSARPQELIVVTSALPEEGKSTTASNLAVVLAESGLRTLLVDADLRRPRAKLFLGVPDGRGLQEALGGSLDLSDLIFQTRVPGLWILRSGRTAEDPAALLASPRSERVFSDLRRAADIVICDAPPVLPVADASILAERADSVLVVHDPRISSRTSLAEAVRQLHTAGASILGGVYNNITAKQLAYMGLYASRSYYGTPATTVATSKRRRPEVARPTQLPARTEADALSERSRDMRSGG
jgi:capsular exopolysaccharide synthesis family protein